MHSQVREKVRESILDMYACMNVYMYRGNIKYVCMYEYVHIDVCNSIKSARNSEIREIDKERETKLHYINMAELFAL